MKEQLPVFNHASEGRGAAIIILQTPETLPCTNREFVGNSSTEEQRFLHPFFPCCKANLDA